jgi:hypothetical protein
MFLVRFSEKVTYLSGRPKWAGWRFGIAVRPQTPKHSRGGWSHYTDTSKPFDGHGAQNMVTVQSGYEPATFRSLAHELINCSNRAHKELDESVPLPVTQWERGQWSEWMITPNRRPSRISTVTSHVTRAE